MNKILLALEDSGDLLLEDGENLELDFGMISVVSISDALTTRASFSEAVETRITFTEVEVPV
jgi:hypothetical protein